MAITRNSNAKYVIPTENEWYKAAYYKGGSTNAGYWLYPTQSNTEPSNVLSSTGTNNANYYNTGYTDPTNYLTVVGAFAASPGPYGTYDMGGDVFQWNEASIYGSYRGLRGGSFYSNVIVLQASDWYGYDPSYEGDLIGFRVSEFHIPGDANGDGQVNGADYAVWAADYGASGATWSQGDFNADGQVNGADYAIWAANYGSTGGVSSTPEPATLSLMALGAVAILRRRR
jgi:hypothetical protein